MSNRAIFISGAKCAATDCVAIYNDKGGKNDGGAVNLARNEMIFFVNGLTDVGGATITFYDDKDNKDNKEYPVKFCVEGKKDGTLEVIGSQICTIRSNLEPADFFYSVAVTGYQTLDPVIIIDGNASIFNFDWFLGAVIMLITAAIAFIGGAKYRLANKKSD